MNYPAGIDLIDACECPRKLKAPVACVFCLYGHILECHYPKTCEEAKCWHLERYREAEEEADSEM